ncbi:glycosyltransferase [Ascidiimonas aurantiaca]|uniref:glycosyltransferase n=1 Tax=Ascidiimonas aurantiaca TaxID=1685432 RepID=UPI0030EB90B1
MSQKPRISILDISFTSGGAEKVISLLLKKLINDYDVTLVLFYNEIHFPIPDEVDTVIFCKQGPDRKFRQKIIDTIGFLFKYHRLLRRKRIEYAVSFLAFPNLINGIIAMFNPRTKMYVSERGFPSDNTTSKLSLKIAKIFYPLLYNRCYKLFSNSVYINQDLKENFGITIPMEVVYNPIELPKNTLVPSSIKNTEAPFKIINVGTLNTRKNQQMIIAAIAQLGTKYELSVLGNGHLENDLKNQIITLQLEKQVFLKGRVKNVNTHLLASDCFVLSSFTEGFPNALLEAMAVGLPCISTNCLSGPLELLHDNKPLQIEKGGFFRATYGILINNDDTAGLAKALRYLCENPEERQKYSALSLERASQYQLDTIYNHFNEFIKS